MDTINRTINKSLFISLGLFCLVFVAHMSTTIAQDTSQKRDDHQRKSAAVKTMTELLATEDLPNFFVMLFKYYIEGEEYRTSGLTLSKDKTENVSRTPRGFECDAYFAPEMVHSEARKEKIANGRVRVRMKVNLEDIQMIIMFRQDGTQAILYQ